MIRSATLADGSTAYKARVGTHGEQRSFTRKRDAEEWEANEKQRRRRERAGLDVEKGPITLDALCELYLDNYTANSKAWTAKMLGYSRKQFGKVQVRNIQPEAVGAWLNGLKLSPKTKTHILGQLRAVMNAGVEWNYLYRSPVRRGAVKNPGKKRLEPINPFRSWNEVASVAEATGSSKWGALIRFACATGLRPGEWAGATWADLDLRAGTMFVRGTKNEGAERTIVLGAEAVAALQPLPVPIGGGLIFTADGGGKIDGANFGRYVWHPALKLASVSSRPPYQMRHTFACLALDAGVPIEFVSKHMGHANIKTTLDYYAKFLPRYEARARALLDQIGSEKGDEDGNRSQQATPTR